MAAKVSDTVQNRTGAAVSGAVVSLVDASGAQVALYKDRDLQVPLTPNPYQATTDDNGYWEAYVVDGTYTVKEQSGNVSRSFSNAQIYDLADLKARTNSSNPTKTVQKYGAVGDGIADDASAFQAFLNAGGGYVPFTTYRLGSGITVPDGAVLYSDALLAYNPLEGAILKFDLGVAACVTVIGANGGNHGCAAVKNLAITRAAGTPPTGSKGLLVQHAYNVLIENVASVSHDQPIVFDAKTYGGISANVTGLYTGAAYDAHIVIDTWPELRVTGGRIGMNGGGDQNCTAYIRVTGGSTVGAAAGPNGVQFVNVQFNQGVNQPAHCISFANRTAGAISDMQHFKFDTCHFEPFGDVFHSDSTWQTINGLRISNTTFNAPGAQLFNLNAATAIQYTSIADSRHTGPLTLAPTPQIDFLTIHDCHFGGNVSITSNGAGSTLDFTNNKIAGSLTIAGPFAALDLTGSDSAGITLTPTVNYQTWTPHLLINGSETGVAYSYRGGVYKIVGSIVFYEFRVTLSSKGSGTGVVQIDGLPFKSNNSAWSLGAGSVVGYGLNLSGTAPPLMVDIGINSTLLNVYQGSATGILGVTNSNLTNTTELAASGFYFL